MDLEINILREVSQIKTNTAWYHLYKDSKRRKKKKEEDID